MKTVYCLYIICFLFFSDLCKAQENHTQANERCPNKEKVKEVFLENRENNKVFYRKSAIPRALRNALNKKFDERFRIANPQRKFRRTDVVTNPLLPDKQLNFIIRNGDYYALVYKQGGRGFHGVFIFAEISSGKVIDFTFYSVSPYTETEEDFLSKIEENKYYN